MTTRARDLPPIEIRGEKFVDRGYCYSVSDLSDGYCVHTATCVSAGQAWSGPNSSCVRNGQDGFALKAERERKADERRFTPPEFRQPNPGKPGPAITISDRRQSTEVVVLRGRPIGPDGKGVGEWTTWEHLYRPATGHWLRQAATRTQPADLTPDEAAALVAEFKARLPHYEFKVVRARLVIDEERLA